MPFGFKYIPQKIKTRMEASTQRISALKTGWKWPSDAVGRFDFGQWVDRILFVV